MAATTAVPADAGYDWPRPSPLHHSSPDQASPIYPDRPIRPLPKRRLRARLSPEQAESIVFPPAPPTTTPLFTFPYSQADKTPSVASRSGRGEYDHPCNCGQDHSDPESDDDDEAGIHSSPSLHYNRKYIGGPNGDLNSLSKPSKPASASSSADGYESFENTNNKKKRKIPNMAGAGGHHTSLSADMASMGISPRDRPSPDDGDGGVGQYYGSGSAAISAPSGTGISGAGRGRYGRSSARTSSERRTPLGASTSAMNAYANGHTNRSRREYGGTSSGKGVLQPEQSGIISTAIAHAQAQPPQNGDENVSLLQQEASKTPPQKTQFTFTCGSDSASKMVWPGQTGTYAPPPADAGKENSWPPSAGVGAADGRGRVNAKPLAQRHPVATQATQTSPNINGAQGGAGLPNAQQQGPAVNGNAAQAPQQPKKPRRRPSREYAIAARQRRLQQEYTNWHNRPTREEIWICEFCEYEDLFGEPPHALVRQYEMKDRKERKRLAEKRRLLEKARMKGRKGKKSSKNSKSSNANNLQGQHGAQQGQHVQGGHQQRYDQALDGGHDYDPNAEEYYEDEYDDGYDDVADLEPIDSPPAKSDTLANGPWKPIDEGPKGTTNTSKRNGGKPGGA